ncbi:hypothetical protein J2Y88_004281 [Pseudomonas chlororaphis]|uniref:hypothetical protein n=1 Tax=Pseudomonas chlororaphis TaxID=587753 RepID=UPI00209F5430|nr:hypothetical protein [Pseudomonas chlororaphis]MCP1481970.1 hypothetical protein [Pseudomonas chlororaphis]MCP1597671.1 hypothetical protein [Pseudomonas chlororaphis]
MTARARSTKKKGSPGKKKTASLTLELKVRNDGRLCGFTVVNFDFLADWLGEDAAPFLKGISRFSRRYTSAAPTYAVRRILEHWASIHRKNGWKNPKETSIEEFKVQLSVLRESFYITETEKGLALTTTTNKWALFITLIEILAVESVIPKVVLGAFMQAPSKAEIITGRQAAVDGVEVISIPKTFRPDKNSYNDDLFEAISITASDIEYLDEYTARLNLALDTIKSCALEDFNLLKEKHAEGRRLIENTGADFLREIAENPRPIKYLDFSTRCHYFSLDGGHPNLLGNILSVVYYEMDGIPKPHRKFELNSKRPVSHSGKSHWQYVAHYGKNKLLPYLGVMSSEAASICMLLIMMDHPKFNSTSLYRAKVEDDDGFSILLSSADGEHERLTVKKPRAREEKSEILSDLAEEVITKVMEWTEPVRKELRKQGRNEEAAQLWLGMSSLNYDLKAFSEKAIVGSLCINPLWRARGKEQVSTRVYSFVERHPVLKPWKEKMNFKALRVNAGVATYLNTDGDLVATAKAFGHKHIRTTINNYIPLALQHAVFERQIRRHQNLLITTALEDEVSMLKVSDFRTVEQLHEFLKSSNSYLFDMEIEKELSCVSSGVVMDSTKISRMVIANDPNALAVAMLYRDSLAQATPAFINRRDSLTGVAPKFWMDFIDAIMEPLPMSMSNLSGLVKKALSKKAAISSTIALPEVR